MKNNELLRSLEMDRPAMFRLSKNFPKQMKKIFMAMSLISSAGMMKTHRLCADVQKPKIFRVEYQLLDGRSRPSSALILKDGSLKGFYNLNRALNRLSAVSTPGRISLKGLCSLPKVVGWFRTQQWRGSKAFVGHFADMAQPFLTAILRDRLVYIFSGPDFRYEVSQQKIATEVLEEDHSFSFYADDVHHSPALKTIESLLLSGEAPLEFHWINVSLPSKPKCSTNNASTCETLRRYIKIIQFGLNVNERIMQCGGAQYEEGDRRFFRLTVRVALTEAWQHPDLAAELLYPFCPSLKSIIETGQMWSKSVMDVTPHPLRFIMENGGEQVRTALEDFTVFRKKIRMIGKETRDFLCSKAEPIAEKTQAFFMSITERGAFFKNELQNCLHEMVGAIFERANSSLGSAARALKTVFWVESFPIFFPPGDLSVQQGASEFRNKWEKADLFVEAEQIFPKKWAVLEEIALAVRYSLTGNHRPVQAAPEGMLIDCTSREEECFFNSFDDLAVGEEDHCFNGIELEEEADLFYDAAESDDDIFDDPVESMELAESVKLIESTERQGQSDFVITIAPTFLGGWARDPYLDDLLSPAGGGVPEEVFLRNARLQLLPTLA